MKDDHPDFYDSPDLGRKVSAYAASHSSALPAHIGEYHARASSHEDAIMLTSNFQSQFHTLLANSIGAKRGKLPLPSPLSAFSPSSYPILRTWVREAGKGNLANISHVQCSKLASFSATRPWSGPTPWAPTA